MIISQVCTCLRNSHERAASVLTDVEVEHFIFNSQRLWLRQIIMCFCPADRRINGTNE